MAGRFLNHYTMLAFTDAYWALSRDERAKVLDSFAAGLPDLAETVHVYQVFPARSDTDILLWCALEADSECAAAGFFGKLAKFSSGVRQYLKPVNTLWGFTRPSQYHPGKSPQELDPSTPERRPYLVIYPFSKTSEWYLLSRDSRQGMMTEHIKLGK